MSSSGKGLSSPKGKKIMNYAYGIGASIVIIGALFKILHWPAAKVMLTLGMGTEALLFALGAFESPHHEGTKWDWSSIYPDLLPEKSPEELMLEEKAAQKEGKDKELSDRKKKQLEAVAKREEVAKSVDKSILTATARGLSDADMEKWNVSMEKISNTADQLSKLATVGDISESYVQKLTVAKDTVEELSNAQEATAEVLKASSDVMSDNFKTSSEKLDLAFSTATEVLKDGLSTVTDKFGNNLETASEDVKKELSSASSIAANTLKSSTDSIASALSTSADDFQKTFADAYSNSANTLTEANQALAEGYRQVTDALSNKLKMIEGATAETGKELQDVSKNLSAINTVYELQLKAINDDLIIKEAQSVTQGAVSEQLKLIQDALSSAAKSNVTYRSESEKLTQSISELNAIYGNMLSSLNA